MPHKDSEIVREAIKKAGRTPIKWQDGKVIQWDSITNDDQIDNLVQLIDRLARKRAVEEVERYADYLADLDTEAAFEMGWQEYAYKRIREIDGEE